MYRGGQVVQLLQAPADQLGVTFNLSGGGREAPGGTFYCRYGVLVPTWILALSLSLAGALLLLAGLVVVAVVVRKVKVKNLQKKRERESCWVQINFATTDMTFDNSLFAISMKMNPEEDAATLDAFSGAAETPGNSGPRKRPTSTSSSPEPPEFSTFRAC
ncbi:hypothetical protein GH733_003699, partial [Mirounga leonina]